MFKLKKYHYTHFITNVTYKNNLEIILLKNISACNQKINFTPLSMKSFEICLNKKNCRYYKKLFLLFIKYACKFPFLRCTNLAKESLMCCFLAN